MKSTLARAIKRAITEKVGYRINTIEAYIVGAYGQPGSDEDTNAGCDDKRELRELEVKAGDVLGCYVYVIEHGEFTLAENIEVELGADCEPIVCRTTAPAGSNVPDYKWEVTLKPGWRWSAGRNAGGMHLFVSTVADFEHARPVQTESLTA